MGASKLISRVGRSADERRSAEPQSHWNGPLDPSSWISRGCAGEMVQGGADPGASNGPYGVIAGFVMTTGPDLIRLIQNTVRRGVCR